MEHNYNRAEFRITFGMAGGGYVCTCDCGWRSRPHPTPAMAQNEYLYDHSGRVTDQ